MLPNSWGGPPGPRVRYGRASPEKADEGVGLRSRGTAPRFILDTAAAYLSGIGRHRLPHQCLNAARAVVFSHLPARAVPFN
jgi:hypothetical protein